MSSRTQCPECGKFCIVDLPSMNKRFCGSCHAEYAWNLKPNQKSVLIRGLAGLEKDEPNVKS